MENRIELFSPSMNQFIDPQTSDEKEIDTIRDNLFQQGVITWKIYIKGD